MSKKKIRLNKVKNRILFISPTVSLGKENEATLGDFNIIAILGSGAFGKVYKVKHKVSEKEFALKVVTKNMIRKYKMEKQIENEVRIMYSLAHPNIISLYNHFEDNDNIYLILELSEQGQLYDKIKDKKRLDEKTAAKYLADLVSGLEFMHTRDPPIIHRDIKPENLLITASGDLKLADFGWSNFGQGKGRETYCGTPEYLAPEMVKESGHTEKLDLWAVGVLLYELLVGRTPFLPKVVKDRASSEKMLHYNILNGRVKYPNDYPALARDLTSKLLKANPDNRISIDQIKKHPWFKQFNLFGKEDRELRSERKKKMEKDALADSEDINDDEMFVPDSTTGNAKPLPKDQALKYSKRGSIMNQKQKEAGEDKNKNIAKKYKNQGYSKNQKNEQIKQLYNQLKGKDDELQNLEYQIQLEEERQRELESNIEEINHQSNLRGREGIIISSLELKKFKLQEEEKDNLKVKYQDLWEKFISKEKMKDNLRGTKNRMEEVRNINKQLKSDKNEIYNQINKLENEMKNLQNLEIKYEKEQQDKILLLNETIDHYQQKLNVNSTDNNDEIIEKLKSYKPRCYAELEEAIDSYINHQKINQKMRDEIDQANFKLKKYDIQHEKKFNDEIEAIRHEQDTVLREIKKKHRNKMHKLHLDSDEVHLEYLKKMHFEEIKKLSVISRNEMIIFNSELNQVEAGCYSTISSIVTSQITALKSKDQEMKLLQEQISELAKEERALKDEAKNLSRKLMTYQNK